MKRQIRAIAEFVIAFLALMTLVVTIGVWRLNSSPITSEVMTPYVEAGVARYIPGAHAKIAHTVLSWDNADHSVALHADGVVIMKADNSVIGEVPNVDIRLSVIGLIVGQFWPIELTIDHPQLKLNRHADGRLYFASMAAGADVTAAPDEEASNSTREAFKESLHNLAHAYAMRHLNVFRAAIDVHDDVTRRSWAVSIPEISLVRAFASLNGTVKLDLTQKDDIAQIELHYTYDAIRALHRVSTRLDGINPAQLAGGHPEVLGLGIASMFNQGVSGEMELAFDPDLNVAAAAGNLHGDPGVIYAPMFWDRPRPVMGFDIEGSYDARVSKLDVQTAAFDFGGPRLNVSIEGKPPEKGVKADIAFTLKVHLENWLMDSFNDLWPKQVIPNAREWMANNLHQGAYDKGDAVFHGALSWDDLANMTVASGQGTISASNGTVNYIDGMPPVTGVDVVATFDLNKMELSFTNGGIGALRLQPFTGVISGLSDNDQFIDLPLKLAGPVPDVLKLIDHPPLRYASAVGLAADAMNGNADGTVHLHFPLLKALATKDIGVTASANLHNITSSQLVKGIDIAQGEWALALDENGVGIKGTAELDKIPVTLDLTHDFHAAEGKPVQHLELNGTVRPDLWKNFGDIFAGSSGSAVFTAVLDDMGPKGMRFTGSVDMGGADIRFTPLNWKKPLNIPALFDFSGEQAPGKDFMINALNLRSPLAAASGRAAMTADGRLKSVALHPLRMGRTLADLVFDQSFGPDGALHFEATGKALDVSGLKGGKDPARSDPRPKEYRVKVEKLYTSDNGIILNASAHAVRDAEGWRELSLHGKADGEHDMALDLTPMDDGTRHFDLTCDDFGKMLKGLGITDTVKEGKVDIHGASTPEHPRDVAGKVDVGSFSVGKLPVLALLLNATSPFGFTGLLTDSASFERMTGEFAWHGDGLDITKLNAAGTSVGMNVAGKVDLDSGRAALHGTLVPFSMVNRILGSIPLIGDLLTGGDGGGVLAVSYTIKGSLADPKVSVNPVSLLTPGFLRNLFFGGDDVLEPEDEPKPDAAQ